VRSKFRRLARLEKLTGPYLHRQKAIEEARLAWQLMAARGHVISLAALVLYGEPKLAEPLEEACKRCRTTFEGRVVRANEMSERDLLSAHLAFGAFDDDKDSDYVEGDYVESVENSFLERWMVKELPGETEQQKFQHVFDIAPPWLLVFTRARTTAFLLGVKCPVLSEAPRPHHIGLRESRKWPEFPNGTLQAGNAIPESPMFTAEEAVELYELLEKPEDERSRHERRRLMELLDRLHEGRPRK
jgi:hypothetical protein